MPRTKESGGLTHEEFLGMWRAYLGLKAERDALREALLGCRCANCIVEREAALNWERPE